MLNLIVAVVVGLMGGIVAYYAAMRAATLEADATLFASKQQHEDFASQPQATPQIIVNMPQQPPPTIIINPDQSPASAATPANAP